MIGLGRPSGWLNVVLAIALFPALTFSFTLPASGPVFLLAATAGESRTAPNNSRRSAAPLYADAGRLDADAEKQAKAVARFTTSYGESSRKYRRTIYSHEDWLLHRSDDRLGDNLRGILFSGIVRQLKTEVTIEIAFATAVVLWNQIGAPQTNLPQIYLPTLPFTLSSPALGLLLVFRTNASYARWMDGRSRWGQIISQSRNMVRMASTFCDREDDSSGNKMENLARHTWLLSRSIMNSLSGPEDDAPYQKALAEAFSDNPQLVSQMLAAPDRASAALMDTSLTLDGLPIDEKRRVEIDKSLVIIGECLSQCERIYQQPVPLVYTRHTARFLSLWLLMLPLGLYTALSSWILVPSVGLLSLFLFGIEELAIQLEEPFSILPMNEYCESIQQTTMGMVEWTDEATRRTMVSIESEK
jgi:putative membrane protein